MNEAKFKELVIKTLKIKPEDYSEELAAGDIPQWDSLGHVTLLQAIENHYGFAFDVVDSIEIETLGDLVDMVKKYTQAAAN
jgi:acyl carrier protein